MRCRVKEFERLSSEAMPKTANPFRVRASSLEEITAVILCGGLGRRLRSAVPDLPKCMAPVAGRPFIDYQLDWLRGIGIRDVVLCTGYKAQSVREYCGNGMTHGLLLRYSPESEPRGTAGALKHAEHYVRRGPFVLLDGDSFFELDLAGMLFDHWSHGARATLGLARAPEPGRYASVWLDPQEQVLQFGNAAPDFESDVVALSTQWVNGGVYVFERSIFELIPNAPEPISLEREILPLMIGVGLYGFRSNAYFIDIGVPEDFTRAQIELPEKLACVPQDSR